MAPFQCQLCGDRIELRDGYYAEGHHIKPLGKPHDGPDVMENIVCVCPNCHTKPDYGAIPLDGGSLRRVLHHVVETEYIEYHNRVIYGQDEQAARPE